ncbi:hypothetical protein ACU5AX_19330 [Sphingomonas sp. XXL09]|uniref:hypothetical protein n=1 Tax=Sphingomonas sp. XXL09 TaxID=3457787 RepID=UPI00406BA5F8
MLVLAHHLPIAQSFGITGAMPVITNGNYGVEMFFLLSGFILTLAHHPTSVGWSFMPSADSILHGRFASILFTS